MPDLSPCLWFDGCAEEAVRFYVSLFPNSRVLRTIHWGEGGHGAPGTVLFIEFELDGRRFNALNGGPEFRFTEAVSFMVPCRTQAEIDRYWDALTSDGGEPSMCGWLKDRFGVSWQVFPERLMEWVDDAQPERRDRVMKSFMPMQKLDLATIERAARGE